MNMNYCDACDDHGAVSDAHGYEYRPFDDAILLIEKQMKKKKWKKLKRKINWKPFRIIEFDLSKEEN